MVFGLYTPEHRGRAVKDRAKHMKAFIAALGLALTTGMGAAQGLDCNMQAYKAVDGIAAVSDHKSVTLTWTGESAQELRAQFTLRDGHPVVQELAARKPGGAWVILGKDLTPQFEVTTGRRRMSKTEKDVLVRLNQDTPENEEIYKWNVFWDAPLAVPGTDRSHLVGPPRTEAEIARAKVSYKSTACTVKTDGDRVSVAFNGLSLGIFCRRPQFTAYKGSSLLRQEAMASTDATRRGLHLQGRPQGLRHQRQDEAGVARYLAGLAAV
jgi:hypothetical protein